MRHLPTVLITTALLLLPFAVIAEREFVTAWPNRLYLPEFSPLPDRHTPIHPIGTFLPPVIRENLTLTTNHNPVLLSASTYLGPSATLTLLPGTSLYASENAALIIAGRLIAHGTASQPITFQSNEKHPLNQTWLGLTALPASTLDLQNITIDDASPAISCFMDSRVTINQSHLRRGSLGIFQTQTACRVNQSFINGPTIGLVSVDTKPQITNSLIVTRQQDFLNLSSSLLNPSQ